MNMSKWTRVLLSAGIVSLPAAMRADDATNAPAPPQPTVLTALSSTTLSGYVDTSAVWKLGTGNANMPGRVYDGPDVQDGFNLNVVSLTLNKPLDDSPWAAGYNVQMLMGPGANKRGTGLGLGGPPVATDFSFNEAYVNLHVPVGNGLELHVGQFGTYNGYEAYDTYKNPNWSRSYGFFIESSAHTGISATYKVCDALTLQGGIGNEAGFNNAVDVKATSESRKAYLVMATLTAPASMGFLKGATLSGGYTVGESLENLGGGVLGTWNQGNIYVGATAPLPVTGLSLGLAYDYTYGLPAAGTIADASSYAHALAGYFMYQPTDKINLDLRLDWGQGSNGSFGYVNPSGNSDDLISTTATVGYSLWKNVISRLEFRWDHTLSGGTPFGGTTAGLGANKNAVSLTANIIYQF